MKNLKTPVRYLKGIGPVRAKTLLKLGITTLEDLLTYYPRTYQDRSKLIPIHRLQVGETQVFSGRIVAHKSGRFRRRGVDISRVILSDGSGYITLLFFKAPHIKSYLPLGQELVVTGRVRRFGRELQVAQFDYEILTQEEPVDTQRIVPLYPLKEGLSAGTQRLLRRVIHSTLDQYLPSIDDPLPSQLILRHHLPDLKNVLRSIHFPEDLQDLHAARRRLIFDEFFLLQLALGQVRRSRGQKQGIEFRCKGELMDSFIQSLPFRLTGAQKRVIEAIKIDMGSLRPMNRLLHGEVGSGKTVVAVCAALLAKECGYQTALMAPTEILAEQHLLNLRQLLIPLGLEVELLTSGIKGGVRDETLSKVAQGDIDIIIGTHALIQEGVEFWRLGLCIVDEQHRFGVLQRSILLEKANQGKISPDVLIMSATPIPRTLALTLYGDLDISFLDELPPGRVKIRTFCRSERELSRIYDFMKREIANGNQAYIVYPLIEPSEELGLKAAEEMVEVLQDGVFKDFRLGLLHGRMPTAEKDDVMRAFRNREIDILVSTTVIEVGIDIPQANLMLIEHAERFGLSQLHQLRGRIGRGGAKSYCILLTTRAISKLVNCRDASDSNHLAKQTQKVAFSDRVNSDKGEEILDEELSNAAKRLKTMVVTNDGFKIAESDLELRGPGEFFGTRQHGMPALKIGHLIRDRQLLELAHQEASLMLNKDPSLKEHPLLKDLLKDYLKDREEFIKVG